MSITWTPKPAEDTVDDEVLAQMFRALAHPARLRILRLLIERNSCVCGDLVDELPLAQSTVSQHLKVLREAGLIRGEIDGPRRCYEADRDALALIKGYVRGIDRIS